MNTALQTEVQAYVLDTNILAAVEIHNCTAIEIQRLDIGRPQLSVFGHAMILLDFLANLLPKYMTLSEISTVVKDGLSSFADCMRHQQNL